jgi:glycosyltransferase involved in cell wall biosynthesis
MRITWLVPGSGSAFYCENCNRDRVLLSALAQRGHDVTAVPLYLPVDLDAEPHTAPVFFGGINVHLQQQSALFRNTPPWFDRLLDHPWMLHLADQLSGMTRAEDLGQTTLSMLRGEDGHQRKELARLLDWMTAEVQPDVIILSNLLLAGLAEPLGRATGARLLALMQDEDEFVDALPDPVRGEVWRELARAAADLDHLVAVSHAYGERMRERLDLEPSRVSVVRPGVHPVGAPREAPGSQTVGFLSRLCPERGFDLLTAAFVECKHTCPGARLLVAGGALDADRPYLREVDASLRAAGVHQDVASHPRFDPTGRADFHQRIDVLAAPDRGAPAYAGYAVEALAAGVPVVATAVGCFVELADRLGGGITLVRPGDVSALAAALDVLLLDPAAARRQGRAGSDAVQRRLSSSGGAAALDAVLDAVRHRPG